MAWKGQTDSWDRFVSVSEKDVHGNKW
jgi:hypothetical protein